ncbi:MAG: DUF1349 domain-containing protein [Chloroflexi bacterium]|nr:DUF1349 domain-containing protein [Chloroflexota bacterium]
MQSCSISEVQFSMIPAAARTPEPASGAVDILPNAVVSWRAGREAAQSIIYASTDANKVMDGSAASVTSTTNSINLGALDVQVGQTYYWRVDEVNEAEVTSVWASPVWSFSTVEAMVVDDFESYGNDSPDRPFQTWLDGIGYSADEFFSVGYGGNGTGAAVGHDIWSGGSVHYNGDIMETGNVDSGKQALPLGFNGASEIQRTFAPAQDWTLGGITTLSIAVRGNMSLSNSNPLYLKINNTKVMYEGDLSVPQWRPWHVDLIELGINLTSITTLSFGVEGSGSGMIYLDSIALYKTAPPVPEYGVIFSDDFETAHDYVADGVDGTGWDGFVGLNPGETVDALNASIDRAGQLYLASTNAVWSDPWDTLGPFLYKIIEGNFIATVKVVDYAGTPGAEVFHNDGSLSARVPNPADAGDGEDWVSIDYFPIWNCGNFVRTADDNSRNENGNNGMAFGLDPWLQLERVGNIFHFRTSVDGLSWTEMDASPITRDDMAGLPLQVGIRHATYSDEAGYIAFDNFSIER